MLEMDDLNERSEELEALFEDDEVTPLSDEELEELLEDDDDLFDGIEDEDYEDEDDLLEDDDA